MEHKTSAVSVKTALPLIVISTILLACATKPPLKESREVEGGFILAEALRNNTVKITTSQQDGFGFVVGERGEYLYIVTANHVVRGGRSMHGGSPQPSSIRVEFFMDQGSPIVAERLATSDRQLDLAVLRAKRPASVVWDSGSLRVMALAKGVPVKQDSAWFVGREGQWFVPTISGSFNQIGLQQYTVEGLPVQPGSSGAPLVSAFGLVGMVTDDANKELTTALPIALIASKMQEWNHPWNLLEFDDRGQVISDYGFKPPPEEGSSKWWLTLVGVVAAALISSGGSDGTDTGGGGTINVTTPTP